MQHHHRFQDPQDQVDQLLPVLSVTQCVLLFVWGPCQPIEPLVLLTKRCHPTFNHSNKYHHKCPRSQQGQLGIAYHIHP